VDELSRHFVNPKEGEHPPLEADIRGPVKTHLTAKTKYFL
jgi:hypothetical protein